MASERSQRGRPRQFDPELALDRSIDLFWAHGQSAVSLRTLGAELGVSQSSLYNTFGSKDDLINSAVARYEEQLDAQVFAELETPSREALLRFVDALRDWVGTDRHRGCLVLNLAAEDPRHHFRMHRYRSRLLAEVGKSLRTISDDERTGARAQLIVAALFGLTLSARTGAEPRALDEIADGIKLQIQHW
ncbi:MAG: TetR/AcrR family transcriptional regulator [Actinomycetota bacterium]